MLYLYSIAGIHNACVIVVLHVGRGIDGHRPAHIEENEKFLAVTRDFIENRGESI